VPARQGQLPVIGHANDAARIRSLFDAHADVVICRHPPGKEHPDPGPGLVAGTINIFFPVKDDRDAVTAAAMRAAVTDETYQRFPPVLKRCPVELRQRLHHIVPVDQELS